MGDTITMQLMKREKGVLVALPKSKWVNVDHPINLGGEHEGGGLTLNEQCMHLDNIRICPWLSQF